MLANLAINRVITGALALSALFFGLVSAVDPVTLIVFLNSLFVGAMVAIIVAFHRLIIGAAFGFVEYDRVRQMTLGFAVVWAVVALSAANSIYLRSAGYDIPANAITAAGRYLAIVAAVLQVTAPDFGYGLFFGRDRRVLWAGFGLGSMAAVLAVWLQWNALSF
ncbi:hypothetical protein ACC862_24300 [Rhizobium ruizarguesonis]